MAAIPPLPPSLKAMQHYMKTATEHDKRDPVVAHYCRLYGMQKAMEIDRTSPEARKYLVALMNYLEQTKKACPEMEAIQNEVVGQAHMENYALQIFLYADNEDRAARFGKNVVKSFYTAGMLFDVLSTFGELSEDIVANRKYAKWKAAYIHNCLKNGETPISGPMAEEGSDQAVGGTEGGGYPGPAPSHQPQAGGSDPPPNQASFPAIPGGAGGPYNLPHAPPATPSEPPAHISTAAAIQQPQSWQPPANPGSVKLRPEDFQRCMKLCKYASSACQYEDSNTAIANLTKAVNLLTTGHE